MHEYYDRRAAEYDDCYLGAGLFAERDRPGWLEELEGLAQALSALPPERTLDVACGTGFLTRHLRGDVVGLDQSEAMLAEARRQAPGAVYELVVVDSARAGSDQDDARQERTLNDGSRLEIYKRWFAAEGLATELGGGATIFAGNWFVAVRSP